MVDSASQALSWLIHAGGLPAAAPEPENFGGAELYEVYR